MRRYLMAACGMLAVTMPARADEYCIHLSEPLRLRLGQEMTKFMPLCPADFSPMAVADDATPPLPLDFNQWGDGSLPATKSDIGALHKRLDEMEGRLRAIESIVQIGK